MRADVPQDGYFRSLTPCREACPVHTDACGYIQAISAGDFDRAYAIARVTNPLASICGRICGAPCEAACRRGAIDQPLSIRALKRAAFEHSKYAHAGPEALLTLLTGQPDSGPLHDRSIRRAVLQRNGTTGKHVVIIGSGPAGLACAHDLALLGHEVTILEMESMAAGMLVLGVPAYRLPRDLIEREVDFIRSLGVQIRCNCEVGKDVDMNELVGRYDAVVVAVGAKRSRLLPVPGLDGPGVLGGVEFLQEVNYGRAVQLGRRVVVVGGGNVAFDVARSVVRMLQLDVTRMAAKARGVEEVRLICLEARHEMPADDVEIIEGTEEGVVLTNGFGPDAVERNSQGQVTGLRCKGVSRVFDEQGRFAPTFTDTLQTFDADSVVFAIGQRFAVDFLQSVSGLDLERNGAPRVLQDNRTSHDKIWVAGDLATGPKLAIHAIASGREAARSIHHALVGEDVTPELVEVHVPLRHYQRDLDYELRRRSLLPVLPTEERIARRDIIVEAPPSHLWAQHEAGRCLNCSVHTLLDPAACILCGGCVEICPWACLKLVPLAEVSLDGVAEGDATVMIKDETACIRCGLCAARCPTHAITMEQCTLEEAQVSQQLERTS